VRPDDTARMLDFFTRLSGESRYLRFLKWIGAPSGKLVHFMTDIDYDRHMAFVCVAPQGTDEQIVGEARYVADACANCEFGIVIADTWRKSGIAGVLMALLMQVACERGVKAMEGSVLRSNTTMLRFVRALGFVVHPVPEDPTTVRVIKALSMSSNHVRDASSSNTIAKPTGTRT
jgi:GNAT superfamily N-acetyltransferase